MHLAVQVELVTSNIRDNLLSRTAVLSHLQKCGYDVLMLVIHDINAPAGIPVMYGCRLTYVRHEGIYKTTSELDFLSRLESYIICH